MSPKWEYGAEGAAYPVKDGEVWKVGEHWFVASDLMASQVLDHQLDHLMSRLVGTVIVYTDPPWSQGLLNGFQTKAGLPRAAYHWTTLYTRIAGVAHARSLPLYVEASRLESRDGGQVAEAIAHPQVRTHDRYWQVRYYRSHVSGLFYAGRWPSPVGAEVVDVDDSRTPGLVMQAHGLRGLVVDPCSGMGQTPREAHRVGWSSLNNELSPRRVSVAMSRMARLLGAQPVRVG